MKIALAQLNYTVGAVQSNKIKIIDSIYKAKKQGADVVLFSEYAISGMNCYDLLNKPSFLESCEVALLEIASHCEGICALVGLPVPHATMNKTISVAAFIDNGHVVRYIGKRDTTLFRDESNFIASSEGPETVVIAGEKADVILSADTMEISSYAKNAPVSLCLCADPFARRVIQRRRDYLTELTYRTGKVFAGVNHLGGQSETVFDGSSGVTNANGKFIAILKSFEEDFCVVDTKNAPELELPRQNEVDNIYRAAKLGLGDYFEKNGFTKASLGLSGGIDSAVVLALAAETLGPENVHALLMPSQFSTSHSVDDAVQMAKGLGVGYDIIPIKEMYDQALGTLAPVFGNIPFGTAEENLQARIRGLLLMAFSNKHGHIVLNCSNKSEAAMGYGTLYGDMVGALSIIGDIYKTEVYELAHYINREREIIPWNIIEKEPSAELRPDQKDSDSLPPYGILDAILFRFVEENQSVEDIINAGYDSELVHFIVERIKFNTFKHRQSCPTLRLSVCPFGVGLILPLINKYIL